MKGAPVRRCMGGGEGAGRRAAWCRQHQLTSAPLGPRRLSVRGLRSKLSDLESENGYNKGPGDTNWVIITRLT